MVSQRLKDFHNFANGAAFTDRGEGGSVAGSVRVIGDPMIFDAHGKHHHYWGPAVLVIFNGCGAVTALEYVDTHKDRNYINEVWRHDLLSDTYKYRSLEDEPGVEGDPTWKSERPRDEQPPEEFLTKFRNRARTFFINSKTGCFMEGPAWVSIVRILEHPVKTCNTLLEGSNFDLKTWLPDSVEMITDMSGWAYKDDQRSDATSRPSKDEVKAVQYVQVAQFTLGLAAVAAREPVAAH